MATRETRAIGWSGSIAVIELPGTVVGGIGVLHLRSVRNELKEFLDLSELKEQSDSMEARRSKRISGSIYASDWYRGLPVPPQIIVGDFNLVPESARFRRDWGDWTDAWEEAGFGTGYTWHSRWFGLRIDRLIHSAGWRTRSVRVGDDVGSDHRPLFVELVRD
jgi:endonuclease/exonuclease/phosphatase family metal-dependent hydrolase